MGNIKLDFTPTTGTLGVKIIRDDIEIHDLTPVTVGSVNTWTDNDSPTEIEVTYKVRPYNIDLVINTDDTTGNTESITPVFVDNEAPSQVTGLVSSNVHETTFTLSWDASTDNIGVTGYKIYKEEIEEFDVGNVLTYDISGQVGVSGHGWKVSAYDLATNESILSAELFVQLVDETAPATVTGLVATGVDETVFTLGWDASSDNVGVTGYTVNKNGFLYSDAGDVLFENIIGQTSGSVNYWTVNAYDAASNFSVTSSDIQVEQTGSSGEDSTLLTGMEAYYKMDETSGTVLTDSSGNSRNGTVSNASIWDTGGKINGGFDCNDDYIGEISSTVSNPLISNTMSISVWHNINSGAEDTRFIFKGNASGTRVFAVTFADGHYRVLIGDSSGNWSYTTIGSVPVVSNSWQHIVVTFTPTGYKLYKNGILEETVTTTVDMKTNSTEEMTFAGINGVGDLVGKMDEVGFWSKTLTQSEVTELYNFGVGLQYPFVSEQRVILYPNNLIYNYGFFNEVNNGTLGVYPLNEYNPTTGVYNSDISPRISNGIATFDGGGNSILATELVTNSVQYKSSNFTMNVWVKNTDLTKDTRGTPMVITFYQSNITPDTRNILLFRHTPLNSGDKYWYCQFYDGGSLDDAVIGAVDSANNTDLTMLTTTLTSSVLKFYINGSYVGQDTSLVNPSTTPSPIYREGISFGSSKPSSLIPGPHPYKGEVHDSMVWDITLSDSDITNLYNIGL